MRLRPPNTSSHPFWSHPFAVSVPQHPPCPCCCLRATPMPRLCAPPPQPRGDPTLAVRPGGVAERAGTGQLRSSQSAHNRCERTGTGTRAALFELVSAPLPLFSKAQDPLPHRSRLPCHSAPPSPLVLDRDRPPCSPSLSRYSCDALLWSSPVAEVVAEAVAVQAQPTPPAPGAVETEGGRKESRAPAGPPRLFPWRRGRGCKGWRLSWEQCLGL